MQAAFAGQENDGGGRFSRVPSAAAIDRRLGVLELRVLIALASYADKVGRCWPHQATLAAKVGARRPKVSVAISNLVRAGYLAAVNTGRSKGQWGQNQYQILYPVESNALDPDRVPVEGTRLDPDRVPVEGTRLDPDRVPVEGTRPGPHFVQKPGPRGGDIEQPIEQPKKEQGKKTHSARTRAGERDALRAEFDRFWEQVPRKVAKGAAEKAYRSARKLADADTLLAGIMRFGAECEALGTEPRFIAHPATWLNARRWLDEPSPSALPRASSDRGKVAAATAKILRNLVGTP